MQNQAFTFSNERLKQQRTFNGARIAPAFLALLPVVLGNRLLLVKLSSGMAQTSCSFSHLVKLHSVIGYDSQFRKSFIRSITVEKACKHL